MSDARQGREGLSTWFVYTALAFIMLGVLAILSAMLLTYASSSPAAPAKKRGHRTTEQQNVTAIHEAGHALLCAAVMPDRSLNDILVYVEYDELEGVLGLTHAGGMPSHYAAKMNLATKADAMYFLGGAAAEEAVFNTKPQQDFTDRDMVGQELLKYCSSGDGSQCGDCPASDLIGKTCMIKGYIVSYRNAIYLETLEIAKLNRELIAQLANELMQQPVRDSQRMLNAEQLKTFFALHPIKMPKGDPIFDTLQ